MGSSDILVSLVAPGFNYEAISDSSSRSLDSGFIIFQSSCLDGIGIWSEFSLGIYSYGVVFEEDI